MRSIHPHKCHECPVADHTPLISSSVESVPHVVVVVVVCGLLQGHHAGVRRSAHGGQRLGCYTRGGSSRIRNTKYTAPATLNTGFMYIITSNACTTCILKQKWWEKRPPPVFRTLDQRGIQHRGPPAQDRHRRRPRPVRHATLRMRMPRCACHAAHAPTRGR